MEHKHRDQLKPNIYKYAGIVLPSEVFNQNPWQRLCPHLDIQPKSPVNNTLRFKQTVWNLYGGRKVGVLLPSCFCTKEMEQ